MLKAWLGALALALAALTAHAGTLSLGYGHASATPCIQAMSVNFGALTPAGQGGAPLKAMECSGGSATITHWTVAVASGNAAYWATGDQPERSIWPTPKDQNSATGAGYATNDILLLSDGAHVEVALADGAGRIENWTEGCGYCNAPTNFQAGETTGAVATVQDLGAAEAGGGAGAGATWTGVYWQRATMPQPTSAGAAANIDGNATSAACATFTVTAYGVDGSTATATLTYNCVADAVNVALQGSQTVDSTFFQAGGVATLNAFAAACAPHADCKLLISTGSIGVNANAGPNAGAPYELTIQRINMQAAIAAASCSGGPCAASAANLLTVEDADRATGTPQANGLNPDARPTVLDGLAITGTSPSGDCATTTQASTVDEYIDVQGITFGGAPLYNYNSGVLQFGASCYIWANHIIGEYAAGFDATPNLVYSLGGNTSLDAVIALTGAAQYLTISQVYCHWVGECVVDDSSYSTSNHSVGAHATHVLIEDLVARDYSQNAIFTCYAAPITFQDIYLIGPMQYPDSDGHIDDYQLCDGSDVSGVTFEHTLIAHAEGNGFQQGLYPGASLSTLGPGDLASDEQVLGLINEGTGYRVDTLGGCDSTVGPCKIDYVTTVKENSGNPGTNSGEGYVGLRFKSQPSDGDHIDVGWGCYLQPPYAVLTCADPDTGSVTFRNTPTQPTDVQIGPYVCNAANDSTQPCTTGSTVENFIAALGVSANGNDCVGVANAFVTALHACSGNEYGAGTNAGVNLNSADPSYLKEYQSIDSKTAAGTNSTAVTVTGGSFEITALGNFPIPTGPSIVISSADLAYNPTFLVRSLFTGKIDNGSGASGDVLTVSAMLSSYPNDIVVGQLLTWGSPVSATATITADGNSGGTPCNGAPCTGTGGVGTYAVTPSQLAASTTITGRPVHFVGTGAGSQLEIAHDFIWDGLEVCNVNSNCKDVYSQSAAQGLLGTTPSGWPLPIMDSSHLLITDDFFAGVDQQGNCATAGCQFPTGNFTEDNAATGANAETNLEACSQACWLAKDVSQVVAAAVAPVQPLPGGNADANLASPGTTARGALDFSGYWNVGAHVKPGWDLQSGPYPYGD